MTIELPLDLEPSIDSVVAHGLVQWAAAGAEVVVRVPALAATHVLDPASALLWHCLDGVSPLADIFTDIADAFGVSAQQVAADCLPVVRSWLRAAIATSGPLAPGPGAGLAPTKPPTGGRTWRRLVDPPNT